MEIGGPLNNDNRLQVDKKNNKNRTLQFFLKFDTIINLKTNRRKLTALSNIFFQTSIIRPLSIFKKNEREKCRNNKKCTFQKKLFYFH